MFRIINPATGLPINEFAKQSRGDIEKLMIKAEDAFKDWSSQPIHYRCFMLEKLAQALLVESASMAAVISNEMGKPIRESLAEIEKCALTCRFFSQNGEQFLKVEQVEIDKAISDKGLSKVRCEPLGVVLGIMPWNYPFWQVFRFAIPSLLLGNVILIKHAPNVFGCAELLQNLFRKADFPDGVFTSLLIDTEDVEGVIADRRVKGVSFTGSTKAGSKVAEMAGRALKKSVLELGGSDPFVVFADADLEKCVEGALSARLQNAGQSCIAAKRFIIHASQYEEFLVRISKHLPRLKVGDPLDPKTDIGPLARRDLLENLERQVDESIKMGALLHHGGSRVGSKGFFYEPTILGRVGKGMPAYEEELFGPVFALIKAESDEEALRIANDTPYGLGASLWSRNLEEAERAALLIQAGTVYINGKVVSNPALPFGGVKNSGYGRELSCYGVKEFANIKTVVTFS